MAKRGKVLRDPHMGPGLLMVEGKQYPFLMEGLWRSKVPAKPGLVVNVDFDSQGNLNSITAVPQAQLDQEQDELARSNRNGVLEGWASGQSGLVQAGAAGVLVVSWLFLTAVSIHLPLIGELDFTFWQVLGYLNAGNSLQSLEVSGNPDSGILGFLAIVVLAGPFLHYLWKDPRACLGGLLPLSFMTLVVGRIVERIHAALASQTNWLYSPVQTNPGHGIFSVLSIGSGTYLSASLAIYLAVFGTKQFTKSRHVREEPIGASLKAA